MFNIYNERLIIIYDLHVLSKNSIVFDYLIDFSLIVRVSSMKNFGIYFGSDLSFKTKPYKGLKINHTTLINLKVLAARFYQ